MPQSEVLGAHELCGPLLHVLRDGHKSVWGQSIETSAKQFLVLKGSQSWPCDSSTYYDVPVVPHKAVAEVSKIGNL